MSKKKEYAVKAGAGASEITFDRNMFPVEGFHGEVHIGPCVRVLLMEAQTRVAIVSCEMVNVPADVIAAVKTIVTEKTDTPVCNVWVHATHVITTPHAPDDPAKRRLFVEALTRAASVAAEQAVAAFQPAVIGVGAGELDVNANRGIQIGGSWYYGLGSAMPSNKKMTILGFQSLDGKPIGFFISYGIKPTAIDNVEMNSVTRKISSDVPGVACRMLERELGAPAMFCMPAAGDQIPRETAMFYRENARGEAELVELSVEEGIGIAERLGREMGEAAIALAGSMIYTGERQKIAAADAAFAWANKSGDGEVKIAVRGITVGDDIALVGLKPEINAVTERELWEGSPYQNTLILSFLDGDQKYMPDAGAYDLQTWEYRRSGAARGGAEKFVETAVELLTNMKSGRITGSTDRVPANGADMAGAKKIMEFGGIEWIVLEEQEGKALAVSVKVLEKRAYHAPGGAVTWEDSELRAYLNGEFYEKTFTDEEKSKIAEVTVENKSNAQYGVAGGNDTVDKVFLLSLSEAEKYLGAGVELLRAVDAGTGEAAWWHLRSPGEAADAAASVNAIGLIDYHGVVDGVADPAGGVRPAMWITGLSAQ